MIVIATFCMHEDDNLPAEHSECDPARFAVVPANIFASNGETVPNRLSAEKIKSVAANVGPTLPLVPSGHYLIVITKNLDARTLLSSRAAPSSSINQLRISQKRPAVRIDLPNPGPPTPRPPPAARPAPCRCPWPRPPIQACRFRRRCRASVRDGRG